MMLKILGNPGNRVPILYIIWMFYNVSMAFVRTTLVKLKSSQSNSVVA